MLFPSGRWTFGVRAVGVQHEETGDCRRGLNDCAKRSERDVVASTKPARPCWRGRQRAADELDLSSPSGLCKTTLHPRGLAGSHAKRVPSPSRSSVAPTARLSCYECRSSSSTALLTSLYLCLLE